MGNLELDHHTNTNEGSPELGMSGILRPPSECEARRAKARSFTTDLCLVC